VLLAIFKLRYGAQPAPNTGANVLLDKGGRTLKFSINEQFSRSNEDAQVMDFIDVCYSIQELSEGMCRYLLWQPRHSRIYASRMIVHTLPHYPINEFLKKPWHDLNQLSLSLQGLC
jgi:hypothetical protein